MERKIICRCSQFENEEKRDETESAESLWLVKANDFCEIKAKVKELK